MKMDMVLAMVEEAAREAGAVLREGIDSQKEIGRKSSDVDLITEFDHKAEAIIVGRIRTMFPVHHIVAEEGDWDIEGGRRTDHVWYIDPLDGTNNYSHGFPVFAVSIALYQNESPLFGLVYDPMRDECFWAAAGQGAYLKRNNNSQKLKVSSRSRLVDSLLATGFPYDRHHSDEDNVKQFSRFLKRALGVRRAGAAALDLAYVAAGRLDGYWEYKLSSWDVAAGLLIVQEAGGRISDADGEAAALAPKMSMVASNSLIHNNMVDILRNGEAV